MHRDPKMDAAIKAGAGLALLVASAVVTDNAGWGKQILVGIGVGVGSAGIVASLHVAG